MILQSSAARQIVKVIAAALAAYSGTLPPAYVAIFGVLAAAMNALSMSGFTTTDWLKFGQKIAGQGALTFGTMLMATQPQLGAGLAMLGGLLAGSTIPVLGTAAKLQAARNSVPAQVG